MWEVTPMALEGELFLLLYKKKVFPTRYSTQHHRSKHEIYSILLEHQDKRKTYWIKRSKVCTLWTPVEKRMKHVDNSDMLGCNDAQGIFNIWLSTLTIHHITAQQNRWK